MVGSKKGFTTHYALVASLRRRGFVRDMLDEHTYRHPNGAALHTFLDGRWKAEALA